MQRIPCQITIVRWKRGCFASYDMSLRDSFKESGQWRKRQAQQIPKDKKAAFPLRLRRLTQSFRKFLNRRDDKAYQNDRSNFIRDKLQQDSRVKHGRSGPQDQLNRDHPKNSRGAEISKSSDVIVKRTNNSKAGRKDKNSDLMKAQGFAYFTETLYPVLKRAVGRCGEVKAALDRLESTYFCIDCYLTNMQASLALELQECSDPAKILSAGDGIDSAPSSLDHEALGSFWTESSANTIASLKRDGKSLVPIVEGRLPHSPLRATKSWPDIALGRVGQSKLKTSEINVTVPTRQYTVHARFLSDTSIKAVLPISVDRVAGLEPSETQTVFPTTSMKTESIDTGMTVNAVAPVNDHISTDDWTALSERAAKVSYELSVTYPPKAESLHKVSGSSVRTGRCLRSNSGSRPNGFLHNDQSQKWLASDRALHYLRRGQSLRELIAASQHKTGDLCVQTL
ncbi:uncharacterized protein LOC111273184 isoform X2 [Varroa jacobsoni]|uniref:uncharacterized protein LOC111273184 isoform X2 n=1 Tax=Varroa jacobsoni TaxID=62625 RepID=UPI000BF66298|nr:uncharacterized protein LOC111273184 isoform X2 [Varroa jacobsoni]